MFQYCIVLYKIVHNYLSVILILNELWNFYIILSNTNTLQRFFYNSVIKWVKSKMLYEIMTFVKVNLVTQSKIKAPFCEKMSFILNRNKRQYYSILYKNIIYIY